jgi:hypothetical protein
MDRTLTQAEYRKVSHSMGTSELTQLERIHQAQVALDEYSKELGAMLTTGETAEAWKLQRKISGLMNDISRHMSILRDKWPVLFDPELGVRKVALEQKGWTFSRDKEPHYRRRGAKDVWIAKDREGEVRSYEAEFDRLLSRVERIQEGREAKAREVLQIDS